MSRWLLSGHLVSFLELLVLRLLGAMVQCAVGEAVEFGDCWIESLSAFAILAITRTSLLKCLFRCVRDCVCECQESCCFCWGAVVNNIVCISPCRSLRIRVARSL